MVLSRGHPASIIRQSGVVFEGEQGKKYAGVIARIVENVQAGLEEISGEQNDGVGSIYQIWLNGTDRQSRTKSDFYAFARRDTNS
jgi:hypothetical protein